VEETVEETANLRKCRKQIQEYGHRELGLDGQREREGERNRVGEDKGGHNRQQREVGTLKDGEERG
jgi:hypothetical protein